MAQKGTVVVRYTTDTSGFDRGTARIESGLTNLKSRISTFAKGAAVGFASAFAVDKIVDFAASSVNAFVKAQKASEKLEDAFSRFPKLADANIKAFEKQAEALAKKTRFDDDATKASQALLAQFDLTGREIQQLTPLLQDYAAKTGKDLPTAATTLGRALLGQGRALKDIGIDLKDTGTVAGNLDVIMGELRRQVGGFAEKEGKTAEGKLEILKNQFGELQEQIGEKLLPILIAFGDWMLDTGIPLLEELGTTAEKMGEKLMAGFKVMVDAILAAFEFIAVGIEKALGWIPFGFGETMHEGVRQIRQFRDDVNDALNGIQRSIPINIETTSNFDPSFYGPRAGSMREAGEFRGSGASGSWAPTTNNINIFAQTPATPADISHDILWNLDRVR